MSKPQKKIMVYVLNMRGEPLMPCSPVKARKLLQAKKAIVKRKFPFTIQLKVASGENRQPITLGVDPGSRYVGLSASTEKAELYAAEVELRPDVSKLLAQRHELRRARRGRKKRYRPARFNNRVRSKHKGWLAPWVEHKFASTPSRLEAITRILPITTIAVKKARFDIQRLQNPSISGKEYQEGALLDFYNVREYVLWRDQYTCQDCHRKIKETKLHVHHIESRLTCGNAPNNLVTLCLTGHDALHAGQVKLNIQRGRSFKDAAYMNITRKTLIQRLQAAYPQLELRISYGYITKYLRDKYQIDKTHHDDAF
ncbi:MAG: RNA-guided endonuclease IscB, partial [Anaerobiospirillum sp.]|nr:RNA-guided endonuclease IscB [Anaerobiospirillum sp.]